MRLIILYQLVIFLIVDISTTQAQKIATQFFDVHDLSCPETSCFYYRRGVVAENGYQDTVKSFYCDTNTLRSIEVYNDKGNMNGLIRFFYKGGQLKEKVTYRDGVRFGNAVTLYRNGKIQMMRLYPDSKNLNVDTPFPYLVTTYVDSLGKLEVANMNGFCHCAGSIDGEDVVESGKILNGLRDSVWTITKNGNVLFIEEYKDGKLLHGTAFEGDKKTTYDAVINSPEFVGGMEGMAKFLMKSLRYPDDTRRYGVDGKVFVQFVISEDGSVTNVEVIKSVSRSVDKEAMRVVNLMPKWKPGLQRGKPTKARFILPIRFKLDVGR